MQKNYKIIITVILLLVLALSFSTKLDDSALAFHDEAFERALGAFALAKSLNMLISFLQGTYISITPVGIGVEFSVGEILDPINDMVERFSWIMLVASVSLGIQKILLTLSNLPLIQYLLLLSSLTLASLVWFKPKASYLLLTFKSLLFFLILKFSVVIFVYIEFLSYDYLMKDDYAKASIVLVQTQEKLESIQNDNQTLQEESLNVYAKPKTSMFSFDSDILAEVSAQFKKAKESLNIKSKIENVKEDLIEAQNEILNLITIFVVQSILLPLLFIWLLIILLRIIFNWRVDKERVFWRG